MFGDISFRNVDCSLHSFNSPWDERKSDGCGGRCSGNRIFFSKKKDRWKKGVMHDRGEE